MIISWSMPEKGPAGIGEWHLRQLMYVDHNPGPQPTFVRQAMDGWWWVCKGYGIRTKKHTGPFKTAEDARAAAEMLFHMGVE
jgi:hypothetical protein